ncbi:MAG: methyltransferase domain-containing protein [Patescibacteria group bacterium]
MNKDYAQFLLGKTKKDYNLISQQFASTRQIVQRDIIELADLVNSGDKVLDSGCGSGRLYQVLKNKNIDYIGTDVSDALIRIARTQHSGARFLIADSLNLPFKPDSFDKVFSVAVLHHIPSKELRLRYLTEAYRVLMPGGLLILRVWNLWQAKKAGWKKILKYTVLKFLGKTRLDWLDIFAPWKNPEGKIVAELYFHCFTKNELKKLTEQAGFKIKKLWQEKSNIPNLYLIAKK